MRYFIELAYKGTNFFGWQSQPNAITIQEVLQNKLSLLLRQPIETTGCGRTDTGVHANQFFAHFDTIAPIIHPAQIVYKLNRMLPDDIVVFNLFEVAEAAHARFDAIERTYRYYIETKKNPFSKSLVTFTPYTPDLNLMNQASKHLTTVEDFGSFCKTGGNNKTNFCKVTKAEWISLDPNRMYFEITADRFLRNMVRAIVGTLLDVGRGKISIEEFKSIVESGQRSVAGQSVSPDGLYLYHIKYPYYHKIQHFSPAFFCFE